MYGETLKPATLPRTNAATITAHAAFMQTSFREKREKVGVGLRYNAKADAAGAQTERRGEAGPVRS
jgi:hypothetical protein